VTSKEQRESPWRGPAEDKFAELKARNLGDYTSDAQVAYPGDKFVACLRQFYVAGFIEGAKLGSSQEKA
jgi:hypothetical protein